MAIDRCVCFDVTFSALKAYANEHASTMDDLRAHFGCGRRCALCVPYIEMMLRTGQTEFHAPEPPLASP
jgi:bacterioferritin-associated ferredoxin